MLVLICLLTVWSGQLNHTVDSWLGFMVENVKIKNKDSVGYGKTYDLKVPTCFCHQDRDFVEVFAGKSEITHALRRELCLEKEMFTKNKLSWNEENVHIILTVVGKPTHEKRIWTHSNGSPTELVLGPVPTCLNSMLPRSIHIAFVEADLHGCAIDIDINPRVFDLTTASGFVFPGCSQLSYKKCMLSIAVSHH